MENLNFVQRTPLTGTVQRQKAVVTRGFPSYPQSSDATAWWRCTIAATSICDRGHDACVKDRCKRKTRPGGQPDGSSHMGAWGGWALAPDTASMGRDYRSHLDRSRQGWRTFNALSIFLSFSAGIFGGYFGPEITARRASDLRPPACRTPGWPPPAVPNLSSPGHPAGPGRF